MHRGARDCPDGFIFRVISALCPVALLLPLFASRLCLLWPAISVTPPETIYPPNSRFSAGSKTTVDKVLQRC